MNALSLLIIGFALGLSACSTFERSLNSGYSDPNTESSTARDFYRERGTQNFNVAREDLGIPASRELSEREVRDIYTRAELTRLEEQIANSQDKRQYYGLKPYFRNDQERVYFLRLPTREVRERWAANNGVTSNEVNFDPGVTRLIETNDIARGMSRGAVRQSWGEPDLVEVAGEPLYGNERWRYTKLVSTDDGYKSETRILFFEAGRIVGWETH